MPFSEKDLFDWVRIQRYRYKDKRLSKAKIELLNEINFEWEIKIKYLQTPEFREIDLLEL